MKNECEILKRDDGTHTCILQMTNVSTADVEDIEKMLGEIKNKYPDVSISLIKGKLKEF